MSNKGRKSEMILLNGLSPDLDLGLEWDNESSKGVMVCTATKSEVIVLGHILLTMDNLSKLKNFKWKYLTKTYNGSWTVEELDWTKIPRPPIPSDEMVKIYLKEGDEDEDGIVF